MKKFAAICTVLFAFGAMLYGVEVNLDISPQPLVLNDKAQLTLTVDDGSFPEIDKLPEIDGIKWLKTEVGRSRSIINGKVTCSLSYWIMATKTGTVSIPKIYVKVGNDSAVTKAFEVKVVKSPQIDQGNGKSGALSDLVFCSVALLSDSKQFYVGEEVPLEICLYSRRKIEIDLNSYPEVDLDNAVLKDYGKDSQDRRFDRPVRSMTEIDGKYYNTLKFRSAVRAISPGVMNGKVVLHCRVKVPRQRRTRTSYFFPDMMEPNYKVLPYDVIGTLKDVKIKALPEVPENSTFLGLIGNWKVEPSVLADTFKQGDPFTLQLAIKGQGSLETLSAPALHIDGFRVYPPEVKRVSNPGDSIAYAEVKYVMIPLRPGKININLQFSIFSCAYNDYESFSIKKILAVEKAQSYAPAVNNSLVVGGNPDSGPDNSRVSEDSRQQKSGHSSILYLKEPQSIIQIPLYRNYLLYYIILFVGAPVLFMLFELISSRRRRIATDPSLRRRYQAQKAKRALIKKLAGASEDDFERIVAGELVEFINDYFMYSPGTTASELQHKLKDHDLARALLSNANAAYMPGADVEPLNVRRKALLKSLKRLSVLIVAFFLISFDLGAANEKTEKKVQINSFPAAMTAYDAGDFAAAAAFYESKLDKAAPDPAILYNLGNCCCQRGELAKALLNYERARLLAPGDSDILENLNYVRRKLFLPQVGVIRNPYDLLLAARDQLRYDQWLLLAAIIWALFFILLLFRRRAGMIGSVTATAICALIFMLCMAGAASRYYDNYVCKRAIVMDKGVRTYSLPSDISGQVLMPLRSGTQVRVIDERVDWCRISVDDIGGWVKSKELQFVNKL